MKQNKTLKKYVITVAAAAAIVLFTVWFEIDTYGNSPELLISFFSDGFFTAAVFYIGFSLLLFISEAGNFYGIQYLSYMVVCLFSFRKERFEDRKNYFIYCTEKKARQKERENTKGKWIILSVGLACLVLSVIFAVYVYRKW